ncbi:hypothetical protein BDZ97DRAFT_1781661 [Flammula alnicola]|nr:hypothetical protein BDZ97DRAFT_1781661 [Flammula alnicola]
MSSLILTAFEYGPKERRVEIELRPTIPENMRGKVALMGPWSQSLVMSMGTDLKHTNSWTCEICDKPARETKYDVASWIHLSEPRLVLYIHHLCEAGNNKCHQIIVAQSRQMGALSGAGIPPQMPLDKPAGVEFPLAGSCCNCKKDITAKSNLSRCGGCKLVRYCSTECQTSDWTRHKKICKTVKSVKWVNWD